jgi:hypothetical protein
MKHLLRHARSRTTWLRASLLSCLLVLAACNSAREHLSFHATFDKGVENSRKPELAQAIARVIQRRVESMEGKVTDLTNNLTAAGTDIAFTVSPGNLASPLTQQLTEPFTFRLMRKAKAGEKPDITISEKGGYMEMGVTEKDVLWLTSGQDDKTKKGWVEILFNTDGKKKVKEALSKTKGMEVALIVRSQLVSTFQSQGIGRENIFIDGVPTPELAGIFSDDVNVGVHATFALKK